MLIMNIKRLTFVILNLKTRDFKMKLFWFHSNFGLVVMNDLLQSPDVTQVSQPIIENNNLMRSFNSVEELNSSKNAYQRSWLGCKRNRFFGHNSLERDGTRLIPFLLYFLWS